MRTNLRIGEILEDKGYVTAEQIGQALAYQKEHRDKRVSTDIDGVGICNRESGIRGIGRQVAS
ncbi:MAG: hypothetical protein ACLT8Y_13125 [Dorea formicigenerans]